MRRAGRKRIVSGSTTLATPPDNGSRDALAAEVENRSERCRHLEIAIRQRIESRLSGRIRNLTVRVLGETVVLDGQCATYYTKQLAQHAALGVLEDEHLENAIVVGLPHS